MYIPLAFTLSLLLMLGACEERFEEFQANPNAPANAPAAFVMPGAMVDLSYYTSYQLGVNYIGLWVQQHASGAYPEEDQYSPRLNDINVYWNNLYDNSLKDFRHIMDKGSSNQIAIAKIMSAYGFMALTDIWGDIPYSSALQAEEGGAFLTPSFDTQEAVYTGIIKDLDDAVKLMDKAAGDVGSEDLVYGGDMDLWEKYANSLRLRAYLHLSEVNEATARAGVVEMLGKSLISSHAENAAILYTRDPGSKNPVHSRFIDRENDFRMSKSLMDRLIGSGDSINPADPRTSIYAQKNSNDAYVGIPNGIDGLGDVSRDNFTTCKFGVAILEADAPAYFITWTEVEFIRAEAAARGWIADDVQTAYENAIKTSMWQYGLTDEATINTFLAESTVAFDAAKAMELISTQKWVAMFGQSVESWTNFRRTGFPDLPIALNDQNNGVFPKRLTYPSIEATTNGDNVTAATSRQGGAELGNALWWDVN